MKSASPPPPDHESLDSILRQNFAMIHAICRRILQHESDADDATQNALISIAKNYGSFDGRSALSTWIYRIATNAALDELRRRQRRPLTLVGYEDRAGSVVDAHSSDQFDAVDGADQLSAALAQIPDEFRLALVLRDVADLEYEEISQVLNIPIGTVRSRIARGRGRLADILGNLPDVNERQTHENEYPS